MVHAEVDDVPSRVHLRLGRLIEPVETFFALASVLGLILIIYGRFEIVRAVARTVNPTGGSA